MQVYKLLLEQEKTITEKVETELSNNQKTYEKVVEMTGIIDGATAYQGQETNRFQDKL